MVLVEIGLDELQEIANSEGLVPCCVKNTNILRLRKKESPNMEDITWEQFGNILKEKNLAIFRAEGSNFVKIMKKR